MWPVVTWPSRSLPYGSIIPEYNTAMSLVAQSWSAGSCPTVKDSLLWLNGLITLVGSISTVISGVWLGLERFCNASQETLLACWPRLGVYCDPDNLNMQVPCVGWHRSWGQHWRKDACGFWFIWRWLRRFSVNVLQASAKAIVTLKECDAIDWRRTFLRPI